MSSIGTVRDGRFSKDFLHPASLDHTFRWRSGHVQHPSRSRVAYLSASAAYPRVGTFAVRPSHLYWRKHHNGPAGLAVDRRNAARVDLGARQLSGAGLERRLAAPGSDRPSWDHIDRGALCERDGRTERRLTKGGPQHGDAQEHIRSRQRRDHGQRQSRARDRTSREAFHRPLSRQRRRSIAAASPIRLPHQRLPDTRRGA